MKPTQCKDYRTDAFAFRTVDPIPQPCYTVLRSPKQGGPYIVCPGPATTPPGATGWNYGFQQTM
jgi:hypothetical protein